MADPAPPAEFPAPGDRQFLWFQGLSVQLLLVTVLIVVVANLLILPPNLSAFEQQWLLDRLRAGELASLVEETAPGGVVTDRVRAKLLANAGVVSIAVQVGDERRLILQAPRLARTPYLVDLRRPDPLFWFLPIRTLTEGGERMVRVMSRPHFREGQFVEVVASDGPLKKELLSQLGRLMAVAAFTSAMAGAVVYASLSLFLVRPMRRITLSMERFRANPDDPRARVAPSGRRDEIGRAESELSRMQADLRAALASRARLAALGEAVAKINHDLRNMLASAQIASDRLASSGDPKVAQTLPRLERALGRAILLASNVLAFGRSEEPAPEVRPLLARAAVEAAAEDAGLTSAGVRLETDIDPAAVITADPEQLHRMLVNLMKNTREAIEGQVEGRRRGPGRVAVSLTSDVDTWRLILTDNGPGLPERARAHIFQPFSGSARPGGAGLGLPIARELAQAHGGDLILASTGPQGTVFELRLPLRR